VHTTGTAGGYDSAFSKFMILCYYSVKYGVEAQTAIEFVKAIWWKSLDGNTFHTETL